MIATPGTIRAISVAPACVGAACATIPLLTIPADVFRLTMLPILRTTGGQELHKGKLELVEWGMRGGPDMLDEYGDEQEALGWGGCFVEESDELKAKFEESHGERTPQNLAAFHDGHHDGCFRWTCCGNEVRPAASLSPLSPFSSGWIPARAFRSPACCLPTPVHLA